MNLPVYINTCGDGHWNGDGRWIDHNDDWADERYAEKCAIQYYVKESEPTLATGKTNPYTYGINGFKADGEGTSDITSLLNGTTSADKTVTAENELKTRNIEVTKIWNDNGYGDSLHYAIDFTLSGSGEDDFNYSETKELPTTAASVTFTSVPMYDMNGNVINYSVAENVHNSTATHQSGYVISEIAATPTASIQKNDTTYTVTPASNNTTVITGYTITNTLPVVCFKADKEWSDNCNQDGQRPETVNFTLNRHVGTDSDQTLNTKSDSSSNHVSNNTNWNVDFGIYPEQDENNHLYIYSVTEEAAAENEELTTLAQRGYTRCVGTTPKTNYTIVAGDTDTITAENAVVTVDSIDYTIPVHIYHFKNVYEPKTTRLKVNKNWSGDENFKTWTRPDSVTLTLCYQYNGGTITDLSTAGDDDPVRKLFERNIYNSNDKFKVTLMGTKAQDTWTNSSDFDFEGLPLYVNVGGTSVYNGTSYPITYSVKETLDGYTVSNSVVTPLTADSNNILTATNTLLTKTIKAKKQWVDNGYTGDQAAHYNVNLTLTNTNGSITAQSDTIPVTASDTEVSFTIPQYLANNTSAKFALTETNQEYGYIATYSDNQSSNMFGNAYSFDAAAIHENAVVTVTNTLPLTTVTVDKAWMDNDNSYQLRPSEIQVQLQRKTSTDSTWTNIQKVTITSPATTATFSKLPKFDVSNQPYQYKVIEDKVNAYQTEYKKADNSYQSEPVMIQDNEDKSTLSFNVRNTLITKPLRLIKVWVDNDYADTHTEKITFTVKKPEDIDMTFTDMSVDINPDDKTQTTWTQNTTAIPVYDKNGTPIQYVITEPTYHFGYQQTTENENKIVTPTKNGICTGNDNYYDSYQITNVLPVTTITASKEWAGSLELYPNCDITVNLSRKTAQESSWSAVLSNQTISATANSTNNQTVTETYNKAASVTGAWNVTFNNLLVYDNDNAPYTYKIDETPVKGYSTEYHVGDTSTQNIAATAEEAARSIIITNTPIVYNAEFVKYDVTDYDKHRNEPNFNLVTLTGAAFELHRVLNNTDTIINVKSNTNGSYSPDTAGTATIISDAVGKIKLSELEPNEYYLIETTAPNGYQRELDSTNTPKKYYFKVDINDSNEISIQYNTTGNANITVLDKGLGSGVTAYGIPNEEIGSHLILIKQDKKENIKLPNAYYYLLRLYNFEYKKERTEGDNEADYLKHAVTALKTNYDTAVGLYWEKVGRDYYKTNSDGELQATGNAHGIYVFYEVKAPAGYEISNTYSETAVSNNGTVLGPVEFHDGYTSEEHKLVHYEPRKNAQVKILKTDDFGNPLKDAVFELYQVMKNDTDVKLATITTGYDGMNSIVDKLDSADSIIVKDDNSIEFDTSKYDWGTEFYFLEKTSPNGYSVNSEEISFILTPEIAEEPLHIVRANDSRLKGKVTLTKIASEATSTIKAGAPLSGAVFSLYKVSDTTPLQTNLTTDVNGKLYIENLDWDDYYLEETKAPIGFKLPSGEAARVYFTVGRGNCGETAQQLIMKNEPLTASLNIIKHIDNYNEAAWGKPAFIFKITQTKLADGSQPDEPVSLHGCFSF